MSEIICKVAPTKNYDIYIAGDLCVAESVCREFCMRGLYVTTTPTTYTFTGGVETGVRVGLINYPRFPKESWELYEHAYALGMLLMKRLDQQSFSIVGPHETYWFSRRPEDLK